jgi:hypothetical protein
LIIVILIISLVYLLTFATMRKKEESSTKLRLETLKSTLVRMGQTHGEGELFCLDRCTDCYLYHNGEPKAFKSDPRMADLVVYTMGYNDKLEKVEFGRYQDHPVCLRFRVHRNGSSTQMVLQNKYGTYYLPALFGKAVRVANLEEAESLWLKDAELLKDTGAYY